MTANLTLQTFVDSIARTANKGFSIAGGRASQTDLFKVEVQFSV
jgi:hypothetical protein